MLRAYANYDIDYSDNCKSSFKRSFSYSTLFRLIDIPLVVIYDKAKSSSEVFTLSIWIPLIFTKPYNPNIVNNLFFIFN